MDKAFLKDNQTKIAAAGLILIILIGGFAITSLSGEKNKTPAKETVDSDPSDSTVSGDGSQKRFISTQKDFKVLEIAGVGNGVVAKYSDGERDLLEYEGEIVANDTVIPKFAGVEDELYYVLNRNDSSYVFNNGENVSKGYGTVNEITETGGELTLTVQEDLLPSFIVRGGEKVGDEYYEATDPAWVNGELAYTAFEDNQEMIVHGGEELEGYDDVGYPIEADGELAYRAQNGNNEFVVHGNQNLGSGYDSIENIYESKGTLTYVANDGGKLKIIRDGENILQENATLLPETVTSIDGNLAYIVRTGEEQKLIFKGENIGEDYNIQFSEGLIANLNGKIGFAAKKDDEWYIVKET